MKGRVVVSYQESTWEYIGEHGSTWKKYMVVYEYMGAHGGTWKYMRRGCGGGQKVVSGGVRENEAETQLQATQRSQ